jgi:hypothetical protein
MNELQRKLYVAYLAMQKTFNYMRHRNKDEKVDVGEVFKEFLLDAVNKPDAIVMEEVHNYLKTIPSMRYIPESLGKK